MAYEKNIWVDRQGVTRYFETVDDDGALIFTPDYAQVTEIGTPVNADNMNHIEEGIAENSQLLTQKVSKTGDTMTGALTIEMVTPHQVFKSTNMTINDSTAATVAYTSFLDKNDNPFGGIALIHQPTIGNYFTINPRDESGVAMTQPFLVGRGSDGDFCSLPMATTTPTATSTARPSLISAVVANYRNGNTWYIKFSDNFKIQGGYVTQTGDGSVTLPLTLDALFAGVSTQVNHILNNGGARICNPRGTGFDYNSPSPFYWVVYGW